MINDFASILAEKLADKVILRFDPQDRNTYSDNDLLNTPKAAAVLGLKSPNTLRNWAKKGLIPPVYDKTTGKYYYRYGDLMRFKKNRMV
ncbi:MAG: helix-turn-helix domain-containing protein [Deferribacteraceae bacterium]|nr:helix-turn-helix domain-containing protein [Deferribacteraceae bacterium]